MIELYYCRNPNGGRDLIIWYGNTQALTTAGQYELCGKVLDTAEKLGSHFLITLGGFRQEEVRTPPQVYCAATDTETLNQVLALGTKIMVGQIFGIAGLLVGLGKIKGFKGFSLLVDTLGIQPDANATRAALTVLGKFLNMNIEQTKVDIAAEETRKTLESFGLIRSVTEEKKKEEQQLRWFI
jgi:proteasome assembly chaperone (PAC2) family protein